MESRFTKKNNRFMIILNLFVNNKDKSKLENETLP